MNKGGAAMKKGKLITRIFGIVLVGLMIGVAFGVGGIFLPSDNHTSIVEAATLADGKGMWIWKIWELGESVSQIIDKLESAGVEWVTIKCGDSDSYYLTGPGYQLYDWAQSYGGFSNVIGLFHNAGVKVFGWHYVYSYDNWGIPGVSEADVSNEILDILGIDGLIIDAEAEYEGEGKGPIAEAYMIAIRSQHPSSFIAYAPFPIIDYHTWFPYLEFGKYCDVVMPQAYWQDIGVTPTGMVDWMNEQWDKWHAIWQSGGHGDSVKPLIPIGQGNTPGSEVTEFCEAVLSRYEGLSLWRYGIMTSGAWTAYAACGEALMPIPTISASEYELEIDVGETDWVKFTVRNDGTEYTDSWGIQVRVGDGLELVEHSSYPWSQGNMCNGKAAEWYETNRLDPGESDYILVGIQGKTASNYESVWYTAWMHDQDGQPEGTQYSNPHYGEACNREYEEYGVEVKPADYDEYFWSVTPYTYDSDSDGFDDSVTLEMDVDTTGEDVYVTVDGELYDPNATSVDFDSTIWNIYDAAIEYGYLDLTNYSSIAGDCTYYLHLYDENGNYEEGWVGSVYLYPLGYVTQPPEVTTHPATNVTSTSATLHGYLDSLGDYNPAVSIGEPAQISLIDDDFIPMEAVVSVEKTIGDRYIEYWEHVTDGGICVKNDYVLIHKDIDSNGIISYEKNWREVEFTTGEIAPFEPLGGEYFWKKTVAFLDSGDCGYFYTLHELQEYPLICWEVRYADGTTTMYDLDGNEIGYGIPAPSKGFSLSGYHEPSWPDPWIDYRLNADGWFQEWNFSTVSLSLPTPTTISSYVSYPDYQYYYALAHGGSSAFLADSEGSYYYASNAAEDMQNRPPTIFAFLGHCEGMTNIEPGTFSYEFRKGNMADTVTVGYSGMSSCPGWSDSLEWQDYMFQKMDEGYTIRDAFDLASAQYPLIANCVVFVGDPDLTVPPVYVSFEWWTDPANKSETFSQPMDAIGSFSESLTELTPGTTYYFQAKVVADGVIVYGDVLSFLTKPDAPISFSASTVSNTQIDLSWTKGAGAQKTKVQRKQGSYPANKDDGTQVYFGTGTSTPDTGLTPGTTYYYRVWSYVQGSEQWSDNYAEDFATTASGVTPPTVTNNGGATDITSNSARLNGEVTSTGGDNPTIYIYWGDNDGGTNPANWDHPENLGVNEAGEFYHDISSLNPGTPYYYRCYAENSAGSDWADSTESFDTVAVDVDISVVLQGGSRPEEGWEVPITIKFFSPGADVMTDTPIYEFHLTTTKSDDTATCQCIGIMPGTYDVTAQAANCPQCSDGNCTLMNVRRAVVISTPSTAVNMGTLLGGDANCDCIINISDFGILAVSYMKTEGEPGYDCRADFDCNGIINISDFGLLAVNYMKMCPVDVSG